MMKTLKPSTPVHRIPDGDGGVPGVGERAGHLLRPVDGVRAALDLGTDAGPVLEPDAEVKLRRFGQRLKFVEGLASVSAPGKLS